MTNNSKRSFCTLVCILAIAVAPACKGPKVRSGATEEETPRMASVLNMGDPKAEPQLVAGFYGVEAGSWRWAGKQFAVNLRPPAGAAQRGGKLTVRLSVPSVVSDKNKSVTLSATAGSVPLAPETYNAPGEYFYVRDIPAEALTGDAVRVDFALDKVMPPAPPDIRELGIIVLSIGLESK